jgi:prevent-host-death family protein
MRVGSVADVKYSFSAYVRDAEHEPVVVTRNGRPVAVLLGVRDEDELERILLAASPRLREVLEASRRQIREGQGVGHEQVWKDADAQPSPGRQRRRRKPAP